MLPGGQNPKNRYTVNRSVWVFPSHQVGNLPNRYDPAGNVLITVLFDQYDHFPAYIV
jgi:hypothetical protein